MRLYILILFTSWLWFNSSMVLAQCCSAGNPSGGDGSNDGLSKNNFRVFVSYKNSLSKDFYHLQKKIEIPYIQKSFYDYTSFSLTYGLLSRFSLHTELGYFIDKTQKLKINNSGETIKASGIGDFGFNLRYVVIKTVKPISQLVFSAGIKAPIGSFKEETDGVTIPLSLQPSSGAFKFNVSVFYFRKRTDRKIGWNSFALFEMSQTINQGYLVYRYGNYFQYALAGSYVINKNITFTVNSKLEWRGKDKRESEIKIESTGSKIILFNPQLSYTFKSNWTVQIMSDIPVYKYVNGYQLTNKLSFQIGLRRNITFCKPKD